jgi:hypothetical protein
MASWGPSKVTRLLRSLCRELGNRNNKHKVENQEEDGNAMENTGIR